MQNNHGELEVPHSTSNPLDLGSLLNPSDSELPQLPPAELFADSSHLKIKLPPFGMPYSSMPVNYGLRRSNRHSHPKSSPPNSASASGSQYSASEKSGLHDGDAEGEDDEDQKEVEVKEEIEYAVTKRGRKIIKKKYNESDDPELSLSENEDDMDVGPRSSRLRKGRAIVDEDDEEPRYNTRKSSRHKQLESFIATEDEDDDEHENDNLSYGRRLRTRNKKPPRSNNVNTRAKTKSNRTGPSDREKRLSRRSAKKRDQEEDVYIDSPHSSQSHSDSMNDDAVRTSSDADPIALEADGEADIHVEDEAEATNDGKPYSLRRRTKINYAIPPPLEDIPSRPTNGASNFHHGANGRSRPRNGAGNWRKKQGGLGWSASGAELSKWMGMGTGHAADDSDSDYAGRSPRKPFSGAMAGAGGAGMLSNEMSAAVAGTPSNLGKISGDAALADADPLGVNTNVTFNEVGGLDDHIHSLKEMTLLPLLYPEVFQRFNVTPPRGVLFHGPPGTGKTLLARALAASCRSEGRSISFFMRKGADCLSKWVGEAERQLRLLFEEARSCQPSIIFFDEIDGLAPVRSSKQDQIHASIVSTLLALMDGMDGRGQVVVIGATNRPDAVDPALRRPGRFDREFYFGLPGVEAREKILGIMTRGWKGWGDDGGEKGQDNVRGLARLTKGYGGADLRALCTEAALNAVQRRYPQIYKSNERLLLAPETIEVGLRDFMISVKKLVPSSARSSSSTASPLPSQFVPLLTDALDKVKAVVGKVLPVDKKRTALEEAEYEVENEEGALEKELMMQAMETLRVYRPRVVIHGPVGMGQGYLGSAVLHHLEGYHVQSLDLGALMGDSTRTAEAAIVQLFVEAKRHQPSILYIPSLVGWCAAISETSRSTVRAMLDTLAPTDPILLLAIVDGEFTSLPRDVRAWFGQSRENRIKLSRPTLGQRSAFFEALLKDVRRPPNEFPDGVARKKRVLEELPIAPPLEPRKPTAAELAVQEENDQRTIALLKYRLGPILIELKRKFRRFTKRATDEYQFDADETVFPPVEPPTEPVQTVVVTENGGESSQNQVQVQPMVNGTTTNVEAEVIPNGAEQTQQAELGPQPPAQPSPPAREPLPPLYDMDLERMHTNLYKGKYLTPQDFLADVGKMVHNATVRGEEDLERLYRAQAMYTTAEVNILDFDPQLRIECERMADRERARLEERRKQRLKGKTSAQQDAPPPLGIRRSTRHNGPQLEFKLMDPTAIERRLKRQRSDEAQNDSVGEDDAINGAQKKAKLMDVDENQVQASADLTNVDEFRTPAVRFDLDVVDDGIRHSPSRETKSENIQMATADMSVDGPEIQDATGALLNSPNTPIPPLSAGVVNGIFAETHVNGAYPDPSYSPMPNQSIGLESSPSKTGGFISAPVEEDTATNDALPQIPSSEPMQIEREPTPLPEFHVDETAVNQLGRELCDRTASLTIEQLEQLRATCLGCVWRRRSDWNRDELVKELSELVSEFVEEVDVDQDGLSP